MKSSRDVGVRLGAHEVVTGGEVRGEGGRGLSISREDFYVNLDKEGMSLWWSSKVKECFSSRF